MIMLKKYAGFLGLTVLLGCGGQSQDESLAENEADSTKTENIITEEISETDTIEIIQEPEDPTTNWKHPDAPYTHFNQVDLDTVHIGPDREITNVEEYFREDRFNVMVLIDPGEYVYSTGLWIDGENIIVKGNGDVSILCDQLYENVMWVLGDNIVIDNLHMMHLMPGTSEGQNCSGRVVGFDGADNVTIMNCDLNGCGLAGLHDNLGNGTIYAEYNYIHNNSLGAYTDIDGGVWQEEIDDHPTFVFKDNLIMNNGFDRVPEVEHEEDTYDH